MHGTEIVSLIAGQNIGNNPAGNNPILNTQNVSGSTPDKGKYVTLDDEEAWNKFFKLQNDPSTNSTNTRIPKHHVHKNSNGEYRYTAEDENKYNGKEILGKVSTQIKEEILKKVGTDAISSIKLKESKNDDNIVEPAIRFMLNGNVKEINMKDLVDGNMCKKYGVKAITLCLPNKTRGLRCRINQSGTRIYEVANGSYEMTLRWFVEGKECNIKINVNDDDTIKLIEGNGVTEEQLKAHKEVKVGRQYEAKFLHEALTSQLQQAQPESAETAKVLPQPSTDVTDVGRPQEHQASVAQGAGKQ